MVDFADVNGQRIAYERHGSGPPVLLLHGFPQTRAMWWRVIPALAERFTVIAADLRGYGQSTRPASMEEMSFRAMGADMVALMASLGFDRFHLAGHDRGARTAHRMALDAPETVASVALLDIVPTKWLLDNITAPLARAYYHWFYLIQPAPFPETMIAHDVDAYFESCLLSFGKADLDDFDADQIADYRRAWHDPACVHAMLNDYRAAVDVDYALDTADLDRQVTCPALVLFGRDGAMGRALDVPGTWSDRLSDMRAGMVPGGHFFVDQSPRETAAALLDFFASLDPDV